MLPLLLAMLGECPAYRLKFWPDRQIQIAQLVCDHEADPARPMVPCPALDRVTVGADESAGECLPVLVSGLSGQRFYIRRAVRKGNQ